MRFQPWCTLLQSRGSVRYAQSTRMSTSLMRQARGSCSCSLAGCLCVCLRWRGNGLGLGTMVTVPLELGFNNPYNTTAEHRLMRLATGGMLTRSVRRKCTA
mmetsp:Transcript_15510/g.17855  ORF Transcript_15510/g.17855 Transcript_15510/m.17855 type:complete len:101 (+) Transcript_15510:849-1151(+)